MRYVILAVVVFFSMLFVGMLVTSIHSCRRGTDGYKITADEYSFGQ